MRRLRWILVPIAAISSFALAWAAASAPAAGEIVFTDVEKQTREFIDYEASITLTPEQEAIKKEALEALPAACCSDNSAYTCCCPCNLSLTIWGLSNLLIAEHGYDADQVRAKVEQWYDFVNPKGFSGDACYTGGCMQAFKDGGCGGMFPDRLVF